MLKQKINSDYMNALKNRDNVTKNLLSVVKGEIQTIEKNQSIDNLSDDEIIKILNKMGKSLRESIQISTTIELDKELSIIESYLPKQMSEIEISEKIDNLISNGVTTMGEIMKSFSGLPVDRGLVSKIYTSKIK
jgi:uncharacterized protein YqeY